VYRLPAVCYDWLECGMLPAHCDTTERQATEDKADLCLLWLVFPFLELQAYVKG